MQIFSRYVSKYPDRQLYRNEPTNVPIKHYKSISNVTFLDLRLPLPYYTVCGLRLTYLVHACHIFAIPSNKSL